MPIAMAARPLWSGDLTAGILKGSPEDRVGGQSEVLGRTALRAHHDAGDDGEDRNGRGGVKLISDAAHPIAVEVKTGPKILQTNAIPRNRPTLGV